MVESKYYVVKSSLLFQEYASFELAMKQPGISIVEEQKEIIPNKWNGATFLNAHFRYSFYSKNGNEIVPYLLFQGWKLYSESDKLDQSIVRVIIEDPEGAIIRKSFNVGMSQLANGISLFLKYSQEGSLRTALLVEENENLKKRIEELEEG